MATHQLKPCPLPQGFGSARGSEHEVWFQPDSLIVIKATHAGECGRVFGPKRFATEAQYLERIAIISTEFALDWHVCGFHGEGQHRRIVTSQRAIRGAAASLPEIAEFMKGMGFEFHRTKYGDAWYRAADNLLVSDAEPNNVLKTAHGLAPIDILASRPDRELLVEAGIRR